MIRHLGQNAQKVLRYDGNLYIRTQMLGIQWAEVLFVDDGPGVAPEEAALLFQQRIVRKAKDEGGLGLMLVRSLIEQMNGSIRLATSDPGMGATFAINLRTV